MEVASKILEASDYKSGIEIIKKENIDLIILAIGLCGKKDGVEFLRELRKHKNTYTIVISGSNRLYEAYDAGADDYLRKPFDPQELKRKIYSFLKRYKVSTKIISCDEFFYLDDEKKIAVINGVEYNLGNKEYDFLYLLALNRGIVLHKDFIYLKVWGDVNDESRKLDVLASRLRGKIPYLKDKVINKPKFGYLLK